MEGMKVARDVSRMGTGAAFLLRRRSHWVYHPAAF
jgi:hypothetical protein